MYFVPAYYSAEPTGPKTVSVSPVGYTETYHIINVSEKQTRNAGLQQQTDSIGNELAQRFNALRTLTDGWYDGDGFAPDDAQLELIATRMVEGYPNHLPLPAIVPTPEGNLLLEWNVSGEPSVDIRLSDLKGEFHVFRADAEDLERDFDLSVADEWPYFFTFLAQTIGGATQ